jgi:hypothetical protein
MKVAVILEAGGSVKAAAFKFQQELLDTGGSEDTVDVELVEPNRILISKAIHENGCDEVISTKIALMLDSAMLDKPIELLLVYYRAIAKWGLYHVQTDRFTTDTAEMLEILVKWEQDGRMNESVEMSASTKLARFARELIAHGFEAEVKNKSKVGIVNRSKLCIQVKGYGIKDEFKLYKPLWKWEADRGELVDVKHERKFATVKEMIAKLKEFYPKLPKCLTYMPPPVKESVGPTLRSRIFALQSNLIEIGIDVGDINKHEITHSYIANSKTFTRYYFPITLPKRSKKGFSEVERFLIVFIDDEGEGLVCTTVLRATDEHEHQAPRLTLSAITKQTGLTRIADWDEAASGQQDSMDDLIKWLIG